MGKTIVAEVLNADGSIYDRAFNWQTAQSMALEGYKVRVIADDEWTIGGKTYSMSCADIQALCDAERERFRDCFGLDN